MHSCTKELRFLQISNFIATTSQPSHIQHTLTASSLHQLACCVPRSSRTSHCFLAASLLSLNDDLLHHKHVTDAICSAPLTRIHPAQGEFPPCTVYDAQVIKYPFSGACAWCSEDAIVAGLRGFSSFIQGDRNSWFQARQFTIECTSLHVAG